MKKCLFTILEVILTSPIILFCIFFKLATADKTPPEITLVGEQTVRIPYEEAYEEDGFTAIDNSDGDITSLVFRKQYYEKVIYKVKDRAGNTSVKVRKIEYIDETPPEITLIGTKEITITEGETYNEQGVKITDNLDYDKYLLDNLEIIGKVNTSVPGEYTIKYIATDSNNNKAEIKRKVIVKKKEEVLLPSKEDKIVYLTFDDGPCVYTEKLLDVLKANNVKATFFVTNANPQYNYLFKRMQEEGHTIGLHTATHEFSQIYSSEEAYYNDLKKIASEVEKQTGTIPTIVRFPGGSSNTVSKQYSLGIMSSLSKSIISNGYDYYDWNVDSQDSSGKKLSSADVKNNIISSLRTGRANVVLQHDIKEFSVNAVEDVIKEAKQMGYEFKAIDSTTPPCKHGINN